LCIYLDFVFCHKRQNLNKYIKLEGCIVLNEHNTVFARSGPLYAKGVTGVSLGPPESSTQTTSRSLQLFLQGSLGDTVTDRLTDRQTTQYSVGNNRRSAQPVEKPNSVSVYGYS